VKEKFFHVFLFFVTNCSKYGNPVATLSSKPYYKLGNLMAVLLKTKPYIHFVAKESV